MSGKFMKVKRIIIPTITMVIMASQLMGCGAASQSELLTMIDSGTQIEIEVATPESIEQGEENSLSWEQLALLDTNTDMRKAWEDTLSITNSGLNKNGIFYINVEGKQEPNNTLRVALHNNAVRTALADEITALTLANAAAESYADIDAEEEETAIAMGINSYFNLLPDATPNYANPDATLSRLEYMALVCRAETPVTEDMEVDSAFAAAVGESDYRIYAQEVSDSSYLDTNSKSLNNMTANGTMTRAEAIYLLISRYYAEELKAVDTKEADITLNDAKDGGDIATAQKFIEDGTAKDYWKSYELTYALQNPDKGLPTDLYKALVVAADHDLITADTRWDEAITKAEALQLLIDVYQDEEGIATYSGKLGEVEVEIIDTPEVDETEDENVGGSMGSEDADPEDDSYIDPASIDLSTTIDPLDKVMYATQTVNLRQGPSVDTEKVGSLTTNQEVHVTGQSSVTLWYEIEQADGSKVYVSNAFLSDTKVQIQQTTPSTQPSGGNTGSTGSTGNSTPSNYGAPGTTGTTSNGNTFVFTDGLLDGGNWHY